MTQDAPGQAADAPVCPRHPDRESYVRCQRCLRPVCPECQREAPVGVQCVDCARAGARSVRAARTVFGGGPTDGRPLVTWSIIGLCVLANVLQRVPGLGVTFSLEFIPALGGSEPWRYLTSAFLHDDRPPPFGLLHIALNMYVLYQLGPYLEDLFGRVRYLALYLLCAVGGAVGFQLLVPDFLPTGATAMVGASGAVFGLFGALLVVQRRLNRRIGQIAGVLVANMLLGFVIPGIAWQAHLGGAVVGALGALVLVHAPRDRRSVVQWSGLAALALVVLALALISLESRPF